MLDKKSFLKRHEVDTAFEELSEKIAKKNELPTEDIEESHDNAKKNKAAEKLPPDYTMYADQVVPNAELQDKLQAACYELRVTPGTPPRGSAASP